VPDVLVDRQVAVVVVREPGDARAAAGGSSAVSPQMRAEDYEGFRNSLIRK
jgi:hypothetical protein